MKIAFCFDLDGTLTREEILPQIAKAVGLYEEIDLLTKITMDGLITFDKSFKLRVKLLSTVPISEVKQIISKITVDKYLQNFVKNNKDCCYIVTGNLDVWIEDFIKEKFGCGYFTSKASYDHDNLSGISHILNKSDAVKTLKKRFDIVISIGDGMNDCSMFEISDKSLAFGGVHEPVSSLIKISDYVCYDSKSLANLLSSFKEHYTNEN
ncbi:HAD-IB family phosphatase [Melioribacteraceae bacterium 4301-Me]|uniref:HAD-IB family phosphatase n=1 Tax=Pyranulibacter aquaticus TaxID=3163344 RepID=UPI00359A64D4